MSEPAVELKGLEELHQQAAIMAPTVTQAHIALHLRYEWVRLRARAPTQSGRFLAGLSFAETETGAQVESGVPYTIYMKSTGDPSAQRDSYPWWQFRAEALHGLDDVSKSIVAEIARRISKGGG